MESILTNLAQVQASTALAIGIMIGLAALGAGLGLAIMAGKFLESAMMARPRPAPSAARPIMMPMARTVEAWTEARAVSAVSMVFSGAIALRLERRVKGRT